MTRLLLHACCAPCSLEPVRLLMDEGFEPTICWTNPNIQPTEEHDRRLAELRRFCEATKLPLIEAHEDYARWEHAVAPIGAQDRPRRCRACYALRLAEACRVARAEGFEHIATTLAVSPYQLFETCNEVLEKLAQAQGLIPVIRDFRPWYPEATRRSRELGMYRQNYCGCRFSAAEAVLDRARLRDERRAHKKARASQLASQAILHARMSNGSKPTASCSQTKHPRRSSTRPTSLVHPQNAPLCDNVRSQTSNRR